MKLAKVNSALDKIVHLFKKLIYGYNDKLKVEVRNYNGGHYWVIYYKLPGYTRRWELLTRCYTLGDSLELLQSDFPVCLYFNQAVEMAKSLTVQSINKLNYDRLEKYKNELNRLQALDIVSKNKTWKNY